MREIKFRAWDNHNHRMLYIGNDLPSYQGWEIMQFTGLLDKNGKEIYEGDILSGNIAGIVQFYRGKFVGCYYGSDGDIQEDWEDDLYMHVRKVEVIGNIYENGDLIDKFH